MRKGPGITQVLVAEDRVRILDRISNKREEGTRHHTQVLVAEDRVRILDRISNKREEGTRHHTSTCGRGQGEDLGPN